MNTVTLPQSIIKQAIAEKFDYEEWKLGQIGAGRVISHKAMLVKMERKIEAASGHKKAA